MGEKIKDKKIKPDFRTLVTIIISAIAIILSQFRPLYEYLEKPKIEVNITPTAQIYHGWGNLGIQNFIQINNTGSKRGGITKIEYYLEKKDNPDYRKLLPAQTYYLQPTTTSTGEMVTQLPFNPVTLEEGESLNQYINFYFPFQREQQLRINGYTRMIQTQIQNKIDSDPFDSSIRMIDDDLYDEIKKFTNTNFTGFGLGEYYLLAIIWGDDSDKPLIMKCYTFSVYEAEIESLNMIIEKYRTGEGVYYPSSSLLGFNATLYEFNDKNITDRLFKNYEMF